MQIAYKNLTTLSIWWKNCILCFYRVSIFICFVSTNYIFVLHMYLLVDCGPCDTKLADHCVKVFHTSDRGMWGTKWEQGRRIKQTDNKQVILSLRSFRSSVRPSISQRPFALWACGGLLTSPAQWNAGDRVKLDASETTTCSLGLSNTCTAMRPNIYSLLWAPIDWKINTLILQFKHVNDIINMNYIINLSSELLLCSVLL